MNLLVNKTYKDFYLSHFTNDTLGRLIFWTEKCGLEKNFPYKLKDILETLNSIIQALNLRVPRNIPYMSIGCVGYVNELTRILIREQTNFEMKEMMLQIDNNLTSFANLSHILDLFECSSAREMYESEGNMNCKLAFDYNFRKMAIVDIFLDVAYFNSYSFLNLLSPAEKREFSRKKYEYFKNKGLNSFFIDGSKNGLDYYSFAFSCHTTDKKLLESATYEYEIDIEKYIATWNDFISEYYPNYHHIEKSVKEQLDLRINEHLPNYCSEYFENKNPGVYFLLRTEKKNIPKIYEKEVCSLFGISECTVGHLKVISLNDFYKYEHLFKNANISAFKIVIQ